MTATTTSRARRAIAAGFAAVTLTVTGCGGSDMPPGVSGALAERVAAVRASAETGDVDEASAALEDIRAQVAHFVESGELSQRRADEILAATEAVAGHLDLVAPEPPPDRDDDEDEEDDARPTEDRGKGEGRGKGNGDEGERDKDKEDKDKEDDEED